MSYGANFHGDEPDGEGSPSPSDAARHTGLREYRRSPAGGGKQKLKGAFLKGPIDWEWIARAAALRKPALPIGLGLWREAGLLKDNFLRDGQPHSKPIRVASRIRKKLRMSTSQMSRGLRALADVGLITILKGGPGRCPIVTVTNLQPPGVAGEQGRDGQVPPTESKWTA